MLLTTVRTVLASAPAVAAICGDRVEILTKPQAITVPNVCLSVVSTTPINGLETWNGLDGNLVQVDCYAATYTEARTLAAACRAAMEAADNSLESEFDNFDESAELSGLARVTQQYSVWS
jgi:hypothetical protein